MSDAKKTEVKPEAAAPAAAVKPEAAAPAAAVKPEAAAPAAAVAKSEAVAPVTKKLVAKYPPFNIVPTGQVVNKGVGDEEGVDVVVDGWVQANIDSGLLIEC